MDVRLIILSPICNDGYSQTNKIIISLTRTFQHHQHTVKKKHVECKLTVSSQDEGEHLYDLVVLVAQSYLPIPSKKCDGDCLISQQLLLHHPQSSSVPIYEMGAVSIICEFRKVWCPQRSFIQLNSSNGFARRETSLPSPPYPRVMSDEWGHITRGAL
jgi:hypothetical protein